MLSVEERVGTPKRVDNSLFTYPDVSAIVSLRFTSSSRWGSRSQPIFAVSADRYHYADIRDPRFTRIRRVSSSFHPVSISPTRKQKVLVPVSARTTSPRRPPYSFDPNPRLGTIYIRT